MGRILAIDYGTRRTGIAVSDPLRLIAGGLETVETKGLEAWLAKYFAREDVSTIVVGKPSRMDGHALRDVAIHRAACRPACGGVARQGGGFLRRTLYFGDGPPDELESGIGRMARRDKALVDKISATIILQSYMESISCR